MVTTISLFFIFSLSISPISETFIKTLNDTKDDVNLLVNKNFTSSIGLRSLWAINGFNNIYNEPLFGSGVGSYEKTIENFIKDNDINVNKKLAISIIHIMSLLVFLLNLVYLDLCYIFYSYLLFLKNQRINFLHQEHL